MTVETVEARVRHLLEMDSVCQGSVTARTVRALAMEFARDPEPDSDVLAERQACIAVLASAAERCAALLPEDMLADPLIDIDAFRLELRRFDEAIAGLRIGLHR